MRVQPLRLGWPQQTGDRINPHTSSKTRERSHCLVRASPSHLLSEQEFVCMYSPKEWQRGGLHMWVQRHRFEVLWSPERKARLHLLLALSAVTFSLSCSGMCALRGGWEASIKSCTGVFHKSYQQWNLCQSCAWKSEIVVMKDCPLPAKWPVFSAAFVFAVCLSVTAALAASGVRRMKKESVNPNT